MDQVYVLYTSDFYSGLDFRIPGHDCVTLNACSRSPAVYNHSMLIFFTLRECGTAGAIVSLVILSLLFNFGIAGAMVLLTLRSLTHKIHFFTYMITTQLPDYGRKCSVSHNRGLVF